MFLHLTVIMMKYNTISLYFNLVDHYKKDHKTLEKSVIFPSLSTSSWMTHSYTNLFTSRFVIDQILSGQSREAVVENIHAKLQKVGDEVRQGELPLQLFYITKVINPSSSYITENSSTYSEHWCSTYMGHWSSTYLEYWSSMYMEHWSSIYMEHWSSTYIEYCSSTYMVHWSSTYIEYWSNIYMEHWSCTYMKSLNIVYMEHWESTYIKHWNGK